MEANTTVSKAYDARKISQFLACTIYGTRACAMNFPKIDNATIYKNCENILAEPSMSANFFGVIEPFSFSWKVR